MFISRTMTLKKSLFSRGSLCLEAELLDAKHWSASLLDGLDAKMGGDEDFWDVLLARW